jgi:hypothetical protein
VRDLILSQATRAICRRLGELKIKLPTVRVWASAERTPKLTWEMWRGGHWFELSREELSEAELGDVRAYVRSDGWSADPRVAEIRHGVFDRMRITMKDGRVV